MAYQLERISKYNEDQSSKPLCKLQILCCTLYAMRNALKSSISLAAQNGNAFANRACASLRRRPRFQQLIISEFFSEQQLGAANSHAPLSAQGPWRCLSPKHEDAA